MGDKNTPEGASQTKVAWLELSEQERKIADAVQEGVKSYLVGGFRDELKAAREKWEQETDPSTRPGFGTAPQPDGADIDFKDFGPVRRAVVSKATGQTLGFQDANAARGAALPPDQAFGESKGGWLIPMDASRDSKALIPAERDAIAKEFVSFAKAESEKPDSPFSVLKFPLGDLENFSIARWAMAVERANNTAEGTSAYTKHAKWETAYYAAVESYANSKAQGDMATGQDGGFLAPEAWSTSFIDQIYPAMATSRLPITRIPMGTRVVHVPRLNANVTVNWAAENASLVASQAQFQQVSWTARKQAVFVQVSNELIRDSNPAAMAIIQNNATRYMAIDMDFQILLGNGQGGAPVGLYNQTNVTKAFGTNGGGFTGTNNATVGTNSNFPKLADLLGAVYNVEDLNGSANVPLAQANCTGVVGAVALKHAITSITDQVEGGGATASARPLYDFGLNQMRWANQKDGSSALDGLFGIPTWVLTNILKKSLVAGSGGASAPPTTVNNLTSPNPVAAANMNPVFFGDWQHAWLMERSDVELLTSNVAGTAFVNDQTWIRLLRRADFGVAHPEPFFVVTNA